MNDRPVPDPTDALRARAERGTPRGADAVLAGARTSGDGLGTDAPAPAPAVRSHRWVLSAAAAIVLVAVAVGAVVASDGDAGASSGSAFCDALEASSLPPYDIDADVIVYLAPGAGAATVEDMRARLEGDPEITAVRSIGTDQTYDRFRDLFRGQDAMLANVEPDELPTSLEVTVADGAEPGEVGARWRSDPDAWEVRDRDTQLGRVLDALVWPGVDPRVTSDDFIGAMGPDVQAGWADRVRAVRDATSPDVGASVALLADALQRRRQPLDPDDPDAREAAAAAATLAGIAETECGLTPRSPAGASPSAPATTVAVTSDPSATSTTSTSTPSFGD